MPRAPKGKVVAGLWKERYRVTLLGARLLKDFRNEVAVECGERDVPAADIRRIDEFFRSRDRRDDVRETDVELLRAVAAVRQRMRRAPGTQRRAETQYVLDTYARQNFTEGFFSVDAVTDEDREMARRGLNSLDGREHLAVWSWLNGKSKVKVELAAGEAHGWFDRLLDRLRVQAGAEPQRARHTKKIKKAKKKE